MIFQSPFLIDYCNDFVGRNLDGVLNVGKKSVMNQYLNDMLAETRYRPGKRYRDDLHHPFIFDLLAAGNVGRPTFDRNWFSDFEEWIQGCKQLANSPVVQRILEVAAVREYEEDTKTLNFKGRRGSSCHNEYIELKQRTRSTSESSLIPNTKEGTLDRCIKRTANMNLSTIELANENGVWLAKEIRSVRKKLKQISNLLDTESRGEFLSPEQKSKIARRPTLETELSIYESAVAEVNKRTKELNRATNNSKAKQAQLKPKKVDACLQNSEAQELTDQKDGSEPSLICDAKNDDDASDSIAGTKLDKPYFCNLCGVKCSDKSNFVLHKNGRKHRNRVAQLAEEEKEKTAASIRQQQQIELMKSGRTLTPQSERNVINAWRPQSSQPNYKLPPPPHPILPPVTTTVPQRSVKSPRSAPPKIAPASPPLSLKTAAKDKGCSNEKQSQGSVNTNSSRKSLSPAASNFTSMLSQQKRSKKKTLVGTKASPKPLVWESSPFSTRCVPLSLYSAPRLPSTPIKTPNREERFPSISLADFLVPTPKKQLLSPPDAAPWTSPCSAKESEASPMPNAKSIAQIQVEEENLRSKQDKSYGKGGGSWYVERRERAESVLEIQKIAQEDFEHRLLVEEQLKIEAQIREENEHRQNLEKEERKPRKDRAPKRRNKKTRTSNYARPNTGTNTGVKSTDASKNNHKNRKNKPSKRGSTDARRQPQIVLEKSMTKTN